MQKIDKLLLFAVTSLVGMILSSVAAFADDWTAVKLRGAVFGLENGQWVQLFRGDVVSDSRYIRTARNGRVQFRRENETIELAPDTQVRIFDRTGQRYTVVNQDFGRVAIEAERQDVQHFAVQTRYLAAVVKGTRFVVSADEFGANVRVSRGLVEARDRVNNLLVRVRPWQSAGAGQDKALEIHGWGARDQIVTYSGSDAAEDVALEAITRGNTGNGDGNGNGRGDENGNGIGNMPSSQGSRPETNPAKGHGHGDGDD